MWRVTWLRGEERGINSNRVVRKVPQPTQPGSGPRQTWKPSSKAAQSAALDVMDDQDTSSGIWIVCHRWYILVYTGTDRYRYCLVIFLFSDVASKQPRHTVPPGHLDWLEENPVDCQKLFSDSTKDAKDEGWQKHVSKGTKSEFHKMIAMFVFSADVDAVVQADFAVNTIKSVNYIAQ